jgi:DNA (cytosine-5)-methyltransferase 1
MRYLSVCSGIEAASVAWEHLGWQPVGFSEIEPFPAAVLAHRFPNIPNYGDMTQHEQWPLRPGSIDLLVGGTPCQSYSVAGLRRGLADPRGNLMLTYLAIADRLRPRWLVWENVPGVLSSNGGRDFGTFLGSLGQLGYGWAYRVLDAQYIRVGRWPRAVPQRRRRVFVVGRLIERGARDWAAPGEVFALAEGLQRHLEARRAKGKGTPSDAEGGVGVGCCGTVSSKWAKGTGGPAGDECYNLIAQPTAYRWQNDRDGLQQDNVVAALRASQGASGFHEMNHPVITQPVPFTKAKRAQSTSDDETWVDGQVNPTLSLFDQGDTRATTVAVAHAFYSTGGTHGVNQHPEVSPAVKVGSGLGIPSPPAVAQSTTVRRLMPIEVERLQGFPDNWTMIPYRGKPADQCPDGPRYKALGNSMACNCMAWIGERIAAYEAQNGST